MQSLVVISSASSPALDHAAVKEHLRVDHDDEDNLIDGLIEAVEAHVAEKLQRSLINQELELRLSGFCAGVKLPKPPFIEISEIVYLDAEGGEQLLDPAVYQIAEDGAGSVRLLLASGQSWPAHLSEPDAVRVRYIAGYGDVYSAIPAPIRHAMLLLVEHYYAHRSAVVSGAVPIVMPLGVEAMLAHFKVYD